MSEKKYIIAGMVVLVVMMGAATIYIPRYIEEQRLEEIMNTVFTATTSTDADGNIVGSLNLVDASSCALMEIGDTRFVFDGVKVDEFWGFRMSGDIILSASGKASKTTPALHAPHHLMLSHLYGIEYEHSDGVTILKMYDAEMKISKGILELDEQKFPLLDKKKQVVIMDSYGGIKTVHNLN